MIHKQDIHRPAHRGLEDLFRYRRTPLRRMYISLGITFVGMIVEIIGGIMSGSLALLSDAGHMFTHIFALGISAFAITLARRPPCHHRTFGLLRAEVLAAYTNSILLFAVTAYIVYEAVNRLIAPLDIRITEMIVVAAIGLGVNIASIALLRKHDKNISIRSAVAHMTADALSSVAIVAGALIMSITGWTWIDAVISMGIAGVILLWAWTLFRDTTRILMEAAPVHVNTDAVVEFVKRECPEVRGMNRVRIWSITEDVVSFTAVINVKAGGSAQESNELREKVGRRLKDRFGFTETTLEINEGDNS